MIRQVLMAAMRKVN